MSIKKKLTFLLIVGGTVLILVFHSAFTLIILPSLENQKKVFIENLRNKIRIALTLEEKNVTLLFSNWSEWESLFNYLENPCPMFEKDVFPDMIFTDDMVDITIAANMEKNSFFVKAYKDKQFLGEEQLNVSEVVNHLKYHISRKPEIFRGVIDSGVGPIMVVAQPIIKGQNPKNTMGMLLMGRFLHEPMMQKLSNYVMETMHVMPWKQREVQRFYEKRMKRKELYYMENQNILTIYYLLRDNYGKPTVILYSNVDNRLFRGVQQNAVFFLLITFFSVILFSLLLYVVIETQIIKRILNISISMKKIEGLKYLSNRITEDLKKDEIAYLVATINTVLDKLEQEKIDREKAEKAMITNGKLASIGRLASCIGHEVNNPLLALSNSIQVIKKISRSKSSLYQEALEISESEISRIRYIIGSLLDFHRVERDDFSYVDVAEVVHKSLDVLKWSKKLGSVEIEEKFEENCLVYGSLMRLKQVFINFILNAVEAMENDRQSEDQSILIVEVKKNKENQEKSIVEIHFTDNGPGISEEIRKNLFEPFVSTKAVKGVGLGLYISYKIINNLHGEIIYDENYKSGTHFIIRIPEFSEA